MGFLGLTRNPELIYSLWSIKDLTVSTKAKCKVMIPYGYLKYRMATIGDSISICACAAVVTDTEYFILNGCAWMSITPSNSEQVKIEGIEYLVYTFNAGDIVCPDLTTVKDSDLLYDMNKYFYSNARNPAYFNYDDIGNIFLYHKEYGGLNISPNNIPFEAVTSVISHDYKDKFKYYRHGDMVKPPVVVPFNSVLFNTTNTASKLLGAYLEDGITSALISPTDRSEPIEALLRR